MPQGSRSRPLLFLPFIDDLPQAVQNSAGKTSFSYPSDAISQLNGAVNKNSTTVFEWLTANKLCQNVAKTKSIVQSSEKKERWLAYNTQLSLNI